MDKKYLVTIVGAGSIGALKDYKYDSPETKNILTHAHAVYNHPRTELVTIIDKDLNKARDAAVKWKCQWYLASSEMKILSGTETDIIILATPTETHYEQLKFILTNLKPKLIIAEKPFCSYLMQAEEIIKLSEEMKIPIMINYTRRFLPEIQQLKKVIDNKTYGNVQHAKLTYTRGIKHEACHAIDLFNFLFGKLKNNLMDDNNNIKDRDANDPTKAGILIYEKCPWVFLCPIDGRTYSIFDIEIFFDTKKISFVEHGSIVKEQGTVPDEYGNYPMLSENATASHINLKQALLSVIDNAVNFLDGKENLKCTSKDAWEVLNVYCQI